MSGGNSSRLTSWVYEGVWGVLTGLLRVPREPPVLPAFGAASTAFKPSERWLAYTKLWFWIGLLSVDLIFTALWLATFFIAWWVGLILAPVWLAIAILPDILVYVGIHLRYDSTWYVLNDRAIRIRRGMWSLHETTITFENVQNVKIHQGPVQRHYGIASLTIHTAGGGGAAGDSPATGLGTHVGLLEGIENATELRDLILSRSAARRSAGLGDEHAGQAHGGAHDGASGWTSEHVRALTAIRDELGAAAAALSR